jgi:hypothetical protein
LSAEGKELIACSTKGEQGAVRPKDHKPPHPISKLKVDPLVRIGQGPNRAFQDAQAGSTIRERTLLEKGGFTFRTNPVKAFQDLNKADAGPEENKTSFQGLIVRSIDRPENRMRKQARP